MGKPHLVLGLLIFLTGCAGMQPQRPAGFEAYGNAVIRVTSDVAKAQEHLETLQFILVDELNGEQVFQSVAAAGEAGDTGSLVIEIHVKRFVEVHNPLRIAVGEMAGSNEVGADVTVIDGSGDQVLSRFYLEAESPEYPPTFDWPWGSIDIAMERFVGALIEVLQDWKQAGAPGG